VRGAGGGLHRGPELRGDEPVELADPDAVPRRAARVLAGRRLAAAQPDSVRRLARPGRLARPLARAHVACALGEPHARGARAAAREAPGALWSSRGVRTG